MKEPEEDQIVSVPLRHVTTEALCEVLIRRGYRVQLDDGSGWMTPKDYSRKFGRHPDYIGRIFRAGFVPTGMEFLRSKGGRLLRVRGNAATEKWMLERKGE